MQQLSLAYPHLDCWINFQPPGHCPSQTGAVPNHVHSRRWASRGGCSSGSALSWLRSPSLSLDCSSSVLMMRMEDVASVARRSGTSAVNFILVGIVVDSICESDSMLSIGEGYRLDGWDRTFTWTLRSSWGELLKTDEYLYNSQGYWSCSVLNCVRSRQNQQDSEKNSASK